MIILSLCEAAEFLYWNGHFNTRIRRIRITVCLSKIPDRQLTLCSCSGLGTNRLGCLAFQHAILIFPILYLLVPFPLESTGIQIRSLFVWCECKCDFRWLVRPDEQMDLEISKNRGQIKTSFASKILLVPFSDILDYLPVSRVKMANIINNYSPKWRWLVVDIYRAAKRRGKYPTLATDTEVNSCFSIY